MAAESGGHGADGPAVPAVPAGERRRAYLVVALVVVLVALPGVRTLAERDGAADGFPLSTYPMFVHDRGRVVEVHSVVAAAPGTRTPVRPGDPVERLSPVQIAATDQVVQASVTVRRAVVAADAGVPGPAADLCTRVAREVDAPAEVLVLAETYDLVDWADDTSVEPSERREVTRCPARR